MTFMSGIFSCEEDDALVLALVVVSSSIEADDAAVAYTISIVRCVAVGEGLDLDVTIAVDDDGSMKQLADVTHKAVTATARILDDLMIYY